MEKRITKRDNYTEILAIVTELGRTDLVDFVNHELELLANRANRNTLTKTQKANLETIEVIYNAVSELAKPVTISELQEAKAELAAAKKEMAEDYDYFLEYYGYDSDEVYYEKEILPAVL